MAVIKTSGFNPLDGTTTFDQMQFGQADDSSGTGAAVQQTSSFDTSLKTDLHPGVTSYTKTDGLTTKYYAVRYRNSSSGVTSDWSTWVLGGKDRWDTMFENEMGDTTNAVFAQADVKRFKEWVLENIFPELFAPVIDTSLVIDNDTTPAYTYTVPFGIFEITEVGVGDIDNVTSTFQVVNHDIWKFENNKLHFMSLGGISDDLAIRIVGSKKYLEVGDVPERFDYIAMSGLKMCAYLFLAEDFPRFKKWGQLQEGTKVSFENMRVHAREFERKFKEDKARAQQAALAINIQ